MWCPGSIFQLGCAHSSSHCHIRIEIDLTVGDALTVRCRRQNFNAKYAPFSSLYHRIFSISVFRTVRTFRTRFLAHFDSCFERLTFAFCFSLYLLNQWIILNPPQSVHAKLGLGKHRFSENTCCNMVSALLPVIRNLLM